MDNIDNEGLSDQIDDYLMDRLSEAERDAFEAEMLVSPEIQRELVFRSTVSNAIWTSNYIPNKHYEMEPAEGAVTSRGWWSEVSSLWKNFSWLVKLLTMTTILAALSILAYLWSRQPGRVRSEPIATVSSENASYADTANQGESPALPDAPAPTAIPAKPAIKSLPEPSAGIPASQTISAEKEAWNATVKLSTCEAYRAFIQQYPQSSFLLQAEQAIQQQCLPTPDHLLPASVKKIQADMVRVEGSEFIMGCRDGETNDSCAASEKPEHLVRVPAFSIGRYEVTQAQWRAVIGSDPPRSANKGCDDCPVEFVSWIGVQEFISKLNTLTKRNYRLPSEAEWEFAARGGSKSKGYRYSGSNDLSLIAWTGKYTKKATQPVGTKAPNELGLYDMSGNVHEWTMDCYNNSYDGAPTDGKAWLTKGNCELRVARGGSWNPDEPASYCRPAFRLYFPATTAIPVVGFRLATD